MTALTYAYATDEDLALRAPADFALLCPEDQLLAAGEDGTFAPSDRWTLASPTVDFLAQGVAPGQVVRLTKPTPTYRPPGTMLVVDAVGAGTVTLRRKGQAPGVGQPPGPEAGLAGIAFAITTLGPQIARASEHLDRRFGIGDLVAGRRASDLVNPHAVREAVVLDVLYRQYLALSRESGDVPDAFATKARLIKQELGDLLGRTVVHWGPGRAAATATTAFSARLAR